jgi:uncharacterized membrane protein
MDDATSGGPALLPVEPMDALAQIPAQVLLVPLLMVATGVIILLYLRASSRLLDRVQREETELWDELGQPQRIYVKGGFAHHGFHTIQPVLPWLGWILGGSDIGLGLQTAGARRSVRRLLLAGLAMFAGTLAAILTVL